MQQKKAVKVLLDTNFLLTMVRNKIHGFEEMNEKGKFEFYTLSGVIGEIEGLSKSDKKIRNEARIVEQVLKNNKVKVLESTMPNIDSELIEKAKNEGFAVATNDKVLRQRVKEAGGKTLYIRSLTYIETGEVE